MTRERLTELVDLVLQCEGGGTSHRVNVTIDNDGDHEINIYPNVNNGGISTTYYCDETRKWLNPPELILDPDFTQAEEHIRRLLNEIKMP